MHVEHARPSQTSKRRIYWFIYGNSVLIINGIIAQQKDKADYLAMLLKPLNHSASIRTFRDHNTMLLYMRNHSEHFNLNLVGLQMSRWMLWTKPEDITNMT